MTGMEFSIRPIQRTDNAEVTRIILSVMREMGVTGCGSSSEDPEVQDMYRAYQGEGSAFYVVEASGHVLGCGGIGPLAGGEEGTCELRKMYFLPELRGRGAGRRLLRTCLDAARRGGYDYCYLETQASMKAARSLYEKNGFELLDERMGTTGHFACGTFMGRRL
jgi:putative acetyltransferase